MYIMNRALLCKVCRKKFNFQLAREFHCDIIHDIHIYMCKICDNIKESQYRGIQYSYFQLLDHIYNFHDSNPYILIQYLNLF